MQPLFALPSYYDWQDSNKSTEDNWRKRFEKSNRKRRKRNKIWSEGKDFSGISPTCCIWMRFWWNRNKVRVPSPLSRHLRLSLRFVLPNIKIVLLTSTAESYSKKWHFRRVWKISNRNFWLRHVCLSVRPHWTTRLSLDGFSWNLIFEYFLKIYRENWSLINTWQE